jgi:hypothetical protein
MTGLDWIQEIKALIMTLPSHSSLNFEITSFRRFRTGGVSSNSATNSKNTNGPTTTNNDGGRNSSQAGGDHMRTRLIVPSVPTTSNTSHQRQAVSSEVKVNIVACDENEE